MGIKKTKDMRRHHEWRIKKKRKDQGYWGRGHQTENNWTDRLLGIAARTPKICSCMGCVNSRKNEGPTLAERRNLEYFIFCIKNI